MLDWVQAASKQKAQEHSKWDPVENLHEESTGYFHCCWRWCWNPTPPSPCTSHQPPTQRRDRGRSLRPAPGLEQCRTLASGSALADRFLRSKTPHSSPCCRTADRVTSGSDLVLVATTLRFAALAPVPYPPDAIHSLESSCLSRSSRLDSLAVYRFATHDHTHHTGTCNTYIYVHIQLCELSC